MFPKDNLDKNFNVLYSKPKFNLLNKFLNKFNTKNKFKKIFHNNT